jgi:Ca2+-binding EF-hand superfamily protein
LSGVSLPASRLKRLVADLHLAGDDENDEDEDGSAPGVDYGRFLQALVQYLDQHLIDEHQSMILDEYDFFNHVYRLIEDLSSIERKEVLSSLYTSFLAADLDDSGYIDIYAFIDILTTHFKLAWKSSEQLECIHRLEARDMKISWKESYEVFLRIAEHQNQDLLINEKNLMIKILETMGVTLEGRRIWLMNLYERMAKAAGRNLRIE